MFTINHIKFWFYGIQFTSYASTQLYLGTEANGIQGNIIQNFNASFIKHVGMDDFSMKIFKKFLWYSTFALKCKTGISLLWSQTDLKFSV